MRVVKETAGGCTIFLEKDEAALISSDHGNSVRFQMVIPQCMQDQIASTETLPEHVYAICKLHEKLASDEFYNSLFDNYESVTQTVRLN